MKIKFLIMLILSFCLLLTGCGGFFQEETVEIASIDSVVLNDGSTQVIITYVDPEMKPTTFIIPKGEAGQTGNGIKNITYEQSDDGGRTVVTIEFTDETVEPKVIAIPNGKSILDIVTDVDPETLDTKLTIVYSDGSIEDPIIVPAGVQGVDGIGIQEVKQRINRDFSVTLTLVLTNGEEVLVEIPAPVQGEDGIGIKDIVSVPNGDTYTMIITFDDEAETTKELEFARPNKWFSEMGAPTPDDGIDGDLWYDLAHQTISIKENGSWGEVLNFNITEPDPFSVKFNLNDNDGEQKAGMPTGAKMSYSIPAGKYFAASNYQIPIPVRPGYEFLGWCTSPHKTPVNGYFTDLTVVQADITLYAIWEIIE